MTTQYYGQSTNADVTCDTATDIFQDLATSTDTGTLVGNTNVETPSFEEAFTFDIDVSGHGPVTGNHDVSIDVLSIDAGCAGRFRIQAVDDTGCAVDNSSSYSSTFSSTGQHTISATNLTWDGSSERLRISVELQRTAGHGNVACTLTLNNDNLYVIAPWTLSAGMLNRFGAMAGGIGQNRFNAGMTGGMRN